MRWGWNLPPFLSRPMAGRWPTESWSRGSAELIWVEYFIWSGEFLENSLHISQRIRLKLPVNLSAFLSRFQAPTPKKLVAQNSRPKLSAFVYNLTSLNQHVFTPIFCLRGSKSRHHWLCCFLCLMLGQYYAQTGFAKEATWWIGAVRMSHFTLREKYPIVAVWTCRDLTFFVNLPPRDVDFQIRALSTLCNSVCH